MSKYYKNLYFWALDYLYIALRLSVGFFDTDDSTQYKNTDGPVVLLIPGVYENWRVMQPVAKALYLKGYDIHIIEGLGYNRGTIPDMASLVNDYIIQNKLNKLTIVAHSKGGLIGKYLLLKLPCADKINGLIALNTPYSGSRYAYLLPFKSLRIFTPKSQMLKMLAADTKVNALIVSIYGIFDPHIPGGSYLSGACNIQLNTHGHFRIMNSSNVHAAILNGIKRLS